MQHKFLVWSAIIVETSLIATLFYKVLVQSKFPWELLIAIAGTSVVFLCLLRDVLFPNQSDTVKPSFLSRLSSGILWGGVIGLAGSLFYIYFLQQEIRWESYAGVATALVLQWLVLRSIKSRQSGKRESGTFRNRRKAL